MGRTLIGRMGSVLKPLVMFALGASIAAVLVHIALPAATILARSATALDLPAATLDLAVVNAANLKAWATSRAPVDGDVSPWAEIAGVYDPDLTFEQWLEASGYEFQVETGNGNLRYLQPDCEPGVVVDVSEAGILAWDLVINESAYEPVMDELANISAAALQSHRLDASPVLEAVSAEHNLPLTVRGNGYIVLFEYAGSLTRSRVTLLGR